MPTYDDAYRQRLSDRVLKAAQRLVARDDAARDGRVIPDHGDLPIGVGRRLEATVLFLDICGSSDGGSDEYADQEATLRAMSLFFGEMIRIVRDYDGRVEKNTGDGLMAYFAHAETGMTVQQTALAAALTMVRTAELTVGPLLDAMGLAHHPFRICLDHGRITVAEVGAERQFREIVAIGTTANIASKMLAFADAGSVFVGDAVAQALPGPWRAHLTETVWETGWLYRTGHPYPFHRFTGRWAVPS